MKENLKMKLNWKKCSEELPQYGIRFFVKDDIYDEKDILIAKLGCGFSGCIWHVFGNEIKNIKYWAEIPHYNSPEKDDEMIKFFDTPCIERSYKTDDCSGDIAKEIFQTLFLKYLAMGGEENDTYNLMCDYDELKKLFRLDYSFDAYWAFSNGIPQLSTTDKMKSIVYKISYCGNSRIVKIFLRNEE